MRRRAVVAVAIVLVALATVGVRWARRPHVPHALTSPALLAATVLFGDGREVIQVLEVGHRVRTVAEFEGQRPLWSPDGQLLAFGRYDGERPTQVWICDAFGGHQRQLTNTRTLANHTSWSPDGDRLYLTASEGGLDARKQIWAIRIATREMRDLSDPRAVDRSPRAAPAGDLIAYARQRSAAERVGAADIWVMAADGSQARPLTAPPHRPLEFAWSPNGEWLYFSSTEGTPTTALRELERAQRAGRVCGADELARLGVAMSIYRIRPDGRGKALVVEGQPLAGGAECSPDLSRIAYQAVGSQTAGEIWVAGMDGSDGRNLSSNAAQDYSPVWSPDGTILVWLRSGIGRDSGIVACDVQSGQTTVVAPNTSQRTYTSVDW